MEITDEEQKLINQYGDYMVSVGFYSDGGGINCWRFKYGENYNDSFWAVDLYCEGEFSPRVYQFKWEFDGINDQKLIAIQDGSGFNTSYKPKTFAAFKKRIDESVAKFGEYEKYKKQIIENKRLKIMQTDF